MPLLYEKRGHIGILTLSRPEARNAWCNEFTTGLQERLPELLRENDSWERLRESFRPLTEWITSSAQLMWAANPALAQFEGKFFGEIAEEMGLDRLTWASYMLYGDPDFTLTSLQPSAGQSTFTSPVRGIELPPKRRAVYETYKQSTKPARFRPIDNERILGWLAAGLFAVVLPVLLLFMLWQPTKLLESPQGLTTPPGKQDKKYALASQDLGEIRVDVNNLQVVPEQRQVIVFFKIVNKTSKDLAIVRGDSLPFVTDNQGFSYSFRDSSGIKMGQLYQQNWTYIPSSGEHTISMRFQKYNKSGPKRDSLYSVSTELVLTSRDDLERTPAGRRPDGARTVNISLYDIRGQ